MVERPKQTTVTSRGLELNLKDGRWHPPIVDLVNAGLQASMAKASISLSRPLSPERMFVALPNFGSLRRLGDPSNTT